MKILFFCNLKLNIYVITWIPSKVNEINFKCILTPTFLRKWYLFSKEWLCFFCIEDYRCRINRVLNAPSEDDMKKLYDRLNEVDKETNSINNVDGEERSLRTQLAETESSLKSLDEKLRDHESQIAKLKVYFYFPSKCCYMLIVPYKVPSQFLSLGKLTS